MSEQANTSGPADEVPTDADFGIQEGEAEELQQKWVTWSEDLEENKRLVIDEYEMTSVAGAGMALRLPRCHWLECAGTGGASSRWTLRSPTLPPSSTDG